MSMNNPYAKYKQNQILSTPPEKLVLMLYDGLIRFINQAKKAIAEKKIEEAHNNIQRAKLIARELLLGLDRSIPISEQLAALYDYMHFRLIKANVKKDTAMLDEVLQMTVELRETWEQAIQIAKKEGHL
ncbi:MAG: flagellar export chaperone FliS [bacterium]